jgi:protein involved in polysaccharide export with SLBB domain
MLFIPLVVLLVSCAPNTRITDAPAALETYQRDAQMGLFTVKGCVHHPGTFSIKPNETVTLAEALKEAGGTITGTTGDDGSNLRDISGANLRDIRVLRINNGSVVERKLDAWPGLDGQNFLIRAGDQIYVPEVIF